MLGHLRIHRRRTIRQPSDLPDPASRCCLRKDDPSDAQVCLELVLHHREKLNPWLPHDAPTRELSCLLQHRRAAVDLRTLLTNMLRDALKSYYPQALELAAQDLFAPLGCQFLLKWPSLQELHKARKESVCASFITRTTAVAWM